MPAHQFALFDTAVGRCGIVWNARGIAGVQLPERAEHATRLRLVRRFSDAREAVPPDHVQQAIEGIVAVLRGEKRDLSGAALDMASASEFHRQVYAVARTIPFGATLSYGDIATRLGDRSAAREVGEAMGQNPFPIIVPCHRVLAAGGKPGGFSAAGGIATKLRLLDIEGAQVGEAPTLFVSLPLAARPGRR
jgi:methylated-DNA-[protein]-cysteine S-methyltransferase